MTDIVKRLRSDNPEHWCREVREEAADQIERLRDHLANLEVGALAEENERLRADLTAAEIMLATDRNDALEEAAKAAEDSNRIGRFKTPSARSFAGLYGRELADAIRALKERGRG